jgi:hypothetical protein
VVVSTAAANLPGWTPVLVTRNLLAFAGNMLQVPEGLLGEMTVNGRVVAATNKLLLQMFVPFVMISLTAHLLILWAVFAGNSAAGVHGPVSFASHFIIASGAWKPLLFTWLAGAVGFYQSPKRGFLTWRQNADVANQHGDGVGAAIGGTLGRIVMLQVATIIGAMLARSYGTIAPWLILIGLKTLTDYQRPDRKPIAP